MRALVGAVAAVVLGVAAPGVGHAAAVVAAELRRAAGHVDAARLVGEVPAVVLRVAFERRGDAAPRLAHELAGAARRLCNVTSAALVGGASAAQPLRTTILTHDRLRQIPAFNTALKS